MTAEILAAIVALREEQCATRKEVRALTALVKQLALPRKTHREFQYEKKRTLLCKLAQATGNLSMRTAEDVMLILLGMSVPPNGQEYTVKQLQREYEKIPCVETIWIAMKKGTDATDVS